MQKEDFLKINKYKNNKVLYSSEMLLFINKNDKIKTKVIVIKNYLIF